MEPPVDLGTLNNLILYNQWVENISMMEEFLDLLEKKGLVVKNSIDVEDQTAFPLVRDGYGKLFNLSPTDSSVDNYQTLMLMLENLAETWSTTILCSEGRELFLSLFLDDVPITLYLAPWTPVSAVVVVLSRLLMEVWDDYRPRLDFTVDRWNETTVHLSLKITICERPVSDMEATSSSEEET